MYTPCPTLSTELESLHEHRKLFHPRVNKILENYLYEVKTKLGRLKMLKFRI